MKRMLVVVAVGLLGVLVGALIASGGCGERPGGTPAAEATTVWTCSMHPQIRQDHPGRCPICGMDLVPAAGEAGAGGAADAAVVLGESAQRIASIEVVPAARRVLEHELATVGRIALAEPLIANLTARTRARVERVW